MANTYNLDTIISKYIHRPIIARSEITTPLYARVSGAESETSVDKEWMKHPDWIKASATTYNSPTNVRRLFIGDKGVFIQYYQPPIMGGKPATRHWLTYTYSDEDRIDKIIGQLLNYNQQLEQALAMNSKAPSPVKVTKTGLGAISNDWKMSNLEEVYITPSILMSDDIRTKINGAEELYKNFLAHPVGMAIQGSIPQVIFEKANGVAIKNIRTRFPRLRTVAFMTNIEAVLDFPTRKVVKDGAPSSLNEAYMNWWESANSNGALKFGSIAVSKIPFSQEDAQTKGVLNFLTRPGIYKYDATILDPFVGKYKEVVIGLARENRDRSLGKEPVQQKNDNAKSEYEKLLDEIYEQSGEAVVQSALILVNSNSSFRSEIKEELGKMSKEGKAKYSALLGIR